MKLIRRNENQRRATLQGAQTAAAALAGLAATWQQMGFDPFTLNHVHGALAAEGRTVETPPTGCSSCKGLLTFASGRSYVEAYMLDAAGTQPTVAGLRISRAKLVEGYLQAVRFDDATGQAVVNTEAVETYAQQYDYYLDPKHEPRYQQLQAFIASYNQLLSDLTPRSGTQPFTLEWKRNMFGPDLLLRDSSSGRLSLNESFVLQNYCRPLPQ